MRLRLLGKGIERLLRIRWLEGISLRLPRVRRCEWLELILSVLVATKWILILRWLLLAESERLGRLL